jgi:hypothetical protein
MANLYKRNNGRTVSVLYPVHGTRNVLRRVIGVKVRSFTGPNGRGITVQQKNGLIRSLSLRKCIASL